MVDPAFFVNSIRSLVQESGGHDALVGEVESASVGTFSTSISSSEVSSSYLERQNTTNRRWKQHKQTTVRDRSAASVQKAKALRAVEGVQDFTRLHNQTTQVAVVEGAGSSDEGGLPEKTVSHAQCVTSGCDTRPVTRLLSESDEARATITAGKPQFVATEQSQRKKGCRTRTPST